MNPIIQLEKTTPLFLVALICFSLAPLARAVVPPPDGDYPNGNTAEGEHALLHLTTGSFNTALGWYSLGNIMGSFGNTGTGAGALFANTADLNTATGAGALLSNTSGENNTANGAFALVSNTEGDANTAIGTDALFTNTTAGSNTAIGAGALFSNTIGHSNTAVGAYSLYHNQDAPENTATGFAALFSNNTTSGSGAGSKNAAFGSYALFSNDGGTLNSAFGWGALSTNQAGSSNTAIGCRALHSNGGVGLLDGGGNTAIGTDALFSNTTGEAHTAAGASALKNNTTGLHNTAIGAASLFNNTIGHVNTALGYHAGFAVNSASNVICIGANVLGLNASNSCFIGNIYHINEGGPDILPVYINGNGQLGTQPPPSSRRFKKDIKPMHSSSEAILRLKPVAFNYESDTKATPQFGLIAEDVAAVHPDLVVRDENGEPHSVRYEAVNAMLLNEFLKEHRKNDEQQATIGELKKELETVVARLKEQDSKIKRVSTKLR